VEIEAIERMQRQAGIDDIELRDEILLLQVGDTVKLTFVKDALTLTGETLAVRITFIRGCSFRGSLTVKPTSTQLSRLLLGATIKFKAVHIHSIRGTQRCDEPQSLPDYANSPSSDR
jgi:hypothetical protein